MLNAARQQYQASRSPVYRLTNVQVETIKKEILQRRLWQISVWSFLSYSDEISQSQKRLCITAPFFSIHRCTMDFFQFVKQEEKE